VLIYEGQHSGEPHKPQSFSAFLHMTNSKGKELKNSASMFYHYNSKGKGIHIFSSVVAGGKDI
jgi:hypothetical protein